MGLAEVKADIKLARDQIANVSSLDELKQQLLDNVLPLMEGMVEATNEGLAEQAGLLDSVMTEVEQLQDDNGDVLMPETLATILAVFDLGRQVATELEGLLKKADDVTKKRALGLIRAFRQQAIVVSEELAEITIAIELDDDAAAPDGALVAAGSQGVPIDDDDEDDEEDADVDDDDDDDDDDDADENDGKVVGGKA
jgi:hypothetical protein